jgi:hypothetical protein
LDSELDPISNSFALLYADSVRRGLPNDRVPRFLKGRVEKLPSGLWISFDDDRLIPLERLSGGGKELFPLLSILDMYDRGRKGSEADLKLVDDSGNHLFVFDEFKIEEPELSVFPQTQFELIKELASMAASQELDCRFVITTHSPYILSSFNNLLEAWQVAAAKPNTKNEVAKLIEERYWIKPSDFKAYSIHDGKLESIMDEDTFLINGNYLDGISNEIGSQFDELLRLGYVEA